MVDSVDRRGLENRQTFAKLCGELDRCGDRFPLLPERRGADAWVRLLSCSLAL